MSKRPNPPECHSGRGGAVPAVERRELLRGSAATFGALLALGKLQACTNGRAGPVAQGAAAGAPAEPTTQTPSAMEPGGPKPMEVPPRTAPNSGTAASAAMPTPNAGAPASSGKLPTEGAAGAGPSPSEPSTEVLRVACAAPPAFPKIVDDAPRATFPRMDQGDALEWLTVGISASLYASQLPECALFMLRALDRVYAGYPISVLAHSLQAASRARAANASDELVLCALCHHLGALLTWEGQAEVSASILRGFVSEDAYRIVRHQLEYQLAHGGAQLVQPSTLRERHAARSWHTAALRFCDEWDSPSYDPNYRTLPLTEFEPLVRAKLGPESGYLVGQLTSTDCIDEGS